MQEFDIYIPSKGRAGNQKTADLLTEAGLRFAIVVEPQELEEYKKAHPKYTFLALEENDKGIAYVRNCILDYKKHLTPESGWICILDDDISGFGDTKDKRTVKKDATILLRAFNTFKRFKKAVNGLNYDHLAWCASKPLSENRFCEVAVFLYIPAISWAYRGEFDLKEDRDFCLQAIKAGAGTLRANELWFSCPSVGTNKGGLQQKYQEKRDEESVRRLAAEWPGVVEPLQKKNRLDMKVNWKNL